MKRVLFIDDDPIFLASFSDRLAAAGISFDIADGPDECVALLAKGNHFNLFVVDVMMPPGKFLSDQVENPGFLTGLALAVVLRERFPAIPIIIFSVIAHKSFFQGAVESAADELPDCILVAKPVEPDRFVETITRALDGDLAKPTRMGILTELGDAVSLKLGAFGVNLDLKKLASILAARFHE